MLKPKGLKSFVMILLFTGTAALIISWSGCDLLTDLGSLANKSSSANSSIGSSAGTSSTTSSGGGSSSSANPNLAITAASPTSISYGAGNIDFSVTFKNNGGDINMPDKNTFVNLFVTNVSGLNISSLFSAQNVFAVALSNLYNGQSTNVHYSVDISGYGQPGNNYFYFVAVYGTNSGTGWYYTVIEPDSDNVRQLNTTPAVKSSSSSSAASSIASSSSSSVSSTASSASAGGGFNFHDNFNRPDSQTIGNGWIQPPILGEAGKQSVVCISNNKLMCQGWFSNGEPNGIVIERSATLISNIRAEFIFSMDQGSSLASLLYTDTNTLKSYEFWVDCSNLVIRKDFFIIGTCPYTFFNPADSYWAQFSRTGSTVSIILSNNITHESTNLSVTDTTYTIFNVIEIGGGWYTPDGSNALRTYIDDFNISGN